MSSSQVSPPKLGQGVYQLGQSIRNATLGLMLQAFATADGYEAKSHDILKLLGQAVAHRLVPVHQKELAPAVVYWSGVR